MTSLRRFTVVESREAMEVTAGNLEEVAAWCGGKVIVGDDVEKSMVTVDSASGYGLDMAHIGDLVVKRTGPPGRPSCRVVSREEFERDLLPYWTEETM